MGDLVTPILNLSEARSRQPSIHHRFQASHATLPVTEAHLPSELLTTDRFGHKQKDSEAGIDI